MRDLIEDSLSVLKKSIQGLFAGPPGEIPSSTVAPHLDERAPQTDPVRSSSAVEVPALPPPRSDKRVRGEEEEEEEEEVVSGRRSTNSTVETPVGHLDRPYQPREDWNPDHNEQRRMGGNRGIQPTNTLNQHPIRALQFQPPPSFGQYTPSPKQATKQQSLSLHASRGSSAAKRPGFGDDIGFEQPARKKLKEDSSTVDLTGDESQDGIDVDHGRAIPRGHNERIPASRLSTTGFSGKSAKRQKHGGDAFGNSEFFNADVDLTFKMPPKSREGGGRKSGTVSSRLQAAQKRSWNDQTPDRQQSGTAQQPVDLEIAHASTSKQESLSAPPMHLMKGVDAAGEEQMRKKQKCGQGSAADLSEVNRVFSAQGRGKPTPAPRGPGRRTVPQVPLSSARSNGKGLVLTTREAHIPSPSSKLQQKFARDVEEIEDDDMVVIVKKSSPVQPPPTRPQIQDHSSDELEGQTTVHSRNMRVASVPRKLVSRMSLDKDRLDGKETESVGAASRLKQTNFTRSDQQSAMKRKQEAGDSWHTTEDNERDKGIAINRIACKAIVDERDGLALLWQSDLNAFVLVAGTDKVLSPLNNGNVLIGQSAISLSWVGHDNSTRVVLKGSTSSTSSGTIAVEFADMDGKWNCYNGLVQEYSGRVGKEKSETQERMDKTFTNMYALESNRHQISLQSAHSEAQRQAIIDRRKQEHTHQQDDSEDDRIVYEEDAPQPTRQKLVSRMQGEASSAANAAPPRKHNKTKEILGRPTAAIQGDYDRNVGDQMQHGTLAEVLHREEMLTMRRRTRQQDGETTSPFFPSEQTRKSTRQSKPPPQYRELSPELVKYSKTIGLPKWAKPIVYPKQGPRRVTIDADDITHLDAGEFLNDNIVNYALRDIEENMHPPHKDRVHFFNTFFYTSLTAKHGKKGINYDAVKKWTKNVDLLSKQYVVVPINLNLHWFVAIIYNLPAVRRKILDSDAVEPANEYLALSESDAPSAKADGTHSRLAKLALTDGPERIDSDDALEEDGVVGEMGESEKVEMKPATSRGKSRKRGRIVPVRKDTANTTMLISLDSFGMTRTNELRHIKQYVVDEAREKRQIDVGIEDLHGVNAKGIPQQNNFYDCGVYLIGYMREFAKDPDRFVKRILGREIDDSDFKEFDTSVMREEIRQKLLKYGDEEDRQYREEKMARRTKRDAQTPQAGKLSAKNEASTRTSAADDEVERPARSSQPTRDSPSALKAGRGHDNPLAQTTPCMPTAAARASDRAEVPISTSSTFPENPYLPRKQVQEVEDDLEVDVPHTLPTAREAVHSDDEMLMKDDARGTDSGTRESQLSPLSSLQQDIRRASAIDAAVKSEGQSKEQTRKLESNEVTDVEIKSGSSDSKAADDRFQGPPKVIDVGDEDDKNLMDDIQGDGDEEQSIEIPDSQEA